MKRKLANHTSKSIKKLGGKETINSGATFQDNDFNLVLERKICDSWNLVSGESKFTEKKQFTLKHEMIQRTIKESKINAIPVVHIGFVEPQKSSDYILLEARTFIDILLSNVNLQKSISILEAKLESENES